MSQTTYTIASHSSGMLIACVPDDGDIDAAICSAESDAGEQFDAADIKIETGLVLTDDDSLGAVRYTGADMGRLVDQSGAEYRYAVRRPPGRPAALAEGKRVNVYLDATSIERAEKLGDGNVSEGIRIALARATN